MARAATSFLEACGLTNGSEERNGRPKPHEIHSVGSRLVIRPAMDMGYPCAVRDQAPFPLENCGIICVERRAVSALAELFDEPRPGQPRGPQIVGIWGPDGSGKTSAVYDLARAARLKGFVPISVRLLASPLASAIDGRSVFLIDDEMSAWPRGLIDAAMRSPRAHVVLAVSREDMRGISSVGLSRLSPASLAAAVRPTHAGGDPRVRRAAERAEGVPGRFLRLLKGSGYERDMQAAAVAMAAERAPVYGASSVAGSATPSSAAWPVPDELSHLRQRMDVAVGQLAAGHHAPGDRALRQAIGGFARRGDWAGAGSGSLALGASLLKRGRPREAKAILDAARGFCQRIPDEGASIALATLSGTAWIDLGRLDEAESVLGAAVALANRTEDGPAGVAASLALARCHFWRGQHAEAEAVLTPYRAAALDDPTIVRLHAVQSRIAVGRFELANAVALAAKAVARAESLAAPALLAEAACAAGFAHLAVSDVAALQRDVTVCLAAASLARSLRAFRAR